MTWIRMHIAFGSVAVLLSLSTLFALSDDLLDRARKAAGGPERFRQLRSVEIRGSLTDSDAAGASGAMAFRVMLPSRFLAIERAPGRQALVSSLDGDSYWAKRGERDIAWHEDGRRRARYRANQFLASYLLYVPPNCSVSSAAGSRSLMIDSACGGLRLDFDPATSALQTMSFVVTVLKGGSADELAKLPGANATEKMLNRQASKATVRTEYSEHRVVEGWRLPHLVVTHHPASTRVFTVKSVRLNPRLTADDFKPGKSVTELQLWVDSASR